MKEFRKFIIGENIRSWLLGGKEVDNDFLPLIPPEVEFVITNEKDNDKKVNKLKKILEKLGYTIEEIRIILRKK